MTKTLKEKAEEKKRLSKEINDFCDQLVYEGTIRRWKQIDLTFLRERDLRELLRRLKG